MKEQVVILQGHPDPAGGHLCHALAAAYKEGAENSGHRVTEVDTARLDFPVLRSRAEWEDGKTPASLLEAQANILRAKHVVIFYPLWLGTMPALLKAFLEQVFRPSLTKGNQNNRKDWRKLMQGCSARIVVTMGMPAFFYRFFYRAHGVKVLERNILAFTGFGPIRTSMVGMVESFSKKKLITGLPKCASLANARGNAPCRGGAVEDKTTRLWPWMNECFYCDLTA